MATDRMLGRDAPGSDGSFGTEDAAELRDVFETASIGLHFVGPDGTILRANSADYGPLGYSADEYIGHNIREFHADQDAIEDIMSRLAAGERLVDYPARLRSKDGSLRSVRIDSSALFRDGKFVHTRCFTRDDTARTEAEESLRRSAERLRSMSDALPVLISYVDAEERYRFNNRAYEDWFGHTREEIHGRTLREVLGDDAYETVRAHVREALAGRRVAYQAMVPYRDGGPRWIEASYVPDVGGDGSVRGFYALIADATARRGQDRELEASERRWRTLAEALPATISQHDSGGAITWVNSRTLEYLGIGPDEIGSAPLDVAHPDDAQRMRDAIRHAAAEGKAATFEWRARRADGAYRWQVSFLTPERDADGNITSWLMTGIDIHDRAVAEEALRESETRYRSLAEAMTSIIWTTAPDARVVDVQEGWGEYTGQSFEQYRGLGWADAAHPDDRAEVMRQWAPAMAELRSFEVTGRIWHAASRSYRYCHARGVPLLNDDGTVGQWVGTLSDIHDQRTAEESLHASVERYRSLTEATSAIVWTTDAAGEFVEPQDAWCRYTGQTWEQARGSGWAEALYPGDRDMILKLWQHALATKEVYDSTGRIWHAASNDYRYFEARGVPVFDAAGEVREWVGTINDVHERHLAALAMQASEEQSRLAAAASRLGTWDWDMGERVRWSEGMEQIYGFAPGSYPGTFDAFLDRVHPDDREATLAAINAAVESGGELDFEHRIVLPDGSIRWLNGRGRVLTNAAGEATRMIGIGLDITEQKQTQQTLIEQQERLRRAQQAGRLGTFDWDVRKNTVVWDGVEAIHGLPPGAFGGTFEAYAADIHPEDRDRVIGAISEAAATVGEVDIEYRIVWPDGSVHWVNGRGEAIAGDDGATVRVTGTCQDIDERKQAESTLRRQASLLNQITDAVIVWERSGDIVFWNGGAEQIYGYPRAEAVGRDAGQLLGTPPEQRAEFLAALGRTGDWFGELRHRRRDGAEIIVESTIATFSDAGGSFVLETTRDITERKRAEQTVLASEAQYRALSNAVPALVVTTLTTGEIETINEAYMQYTGLTVEEARDWETHQVIHPDDMGLSMEKWTHSLATGDPLVSEFRMRRHDGAYRWHLVHGVPMTQADGVVSRWVTVSVDIDDRRRAEEDERFLSEARAVMAQSLDYDEALRRLMDLLVPRMGEWASLALAEGDGTIHRTIARYSDPAFEALARTTARYDPDAATGTGAVIRTRQSELLTDIPDDAYEAFDEPFRQTAKNVGARSAMIVPLRFHDQSAGAITVSSLMPGRYRQADLAVMEAFAHHAATALDNARLVSDLRESAEHLQRALSAKDEFLGMVSHELKTPITTIFGNAEVLQRRGEELGADVRADAIGDIRQEAERLHRIIENMLVLSRLERGQELETEPLLVRRIVERVVTQHRRRHPQREVITEWETHLVPVLASPEYVEQVTGNLLSNAEKYSPADQRIEIRGSREGNEMIVRVCDRGRGIPPDEAEAIFTPFYRSARTAASVQGAGIGLAVCKRLIEAQSGRLWVEQREGGGSAFCFALPVEDEPEV